MDSTKLTMPNAADSATASENDADLPFAQDESAEPSQTAPGAVPAAQHARIGKTIVRLLSRAAFACVCSLSGMAVSLAVSPTREESEPEPTGTPEQSHSHSQHVEEHEREPDSAYDGHRIDLLLRSGDFRAALQLCRNSSPVAFGSDERPLAYREGLCLEALGRWDEAREAYTRAAQPNPDLPAVLWARSELGKARCALAEGRLPESRETLQRVLLKSGDPSCRGKRILEECLFLLGLVELQTLAPQTPLDPFDSSAISWPTFDGGLDRYLDWLATEAPPAPPRHEHQPNQTHGANGHDAHAAATHEAGDHAPEHKHEPAQHDARPAPAHELHPAPQAKDHGHTAPEPKHDPHAAPEPKHDSHPAPEPKEQAHPASKPKQEEAGSSRKPTWMGGAIGRAFVSLKGPERPVAEQLRLVAAAAGMPVTIEAKAEEKLSGTASTLDVDYAPVGAVLNALTQPAGCGWRLVNGAIVIGLPAKLEETAQRELALNALRQGLFYAPEHPCARAARIAASNLEYQSGRVRKAFSEYRQFLDRDPHSAESVHAAFNLGMIELADGNWPFAQARFFDAIDRGPEKLWADHGWWWLGRLHLDRGDAAAARKPLRLAQAGRTKVVASAAGLAIPFCALLEGDEDEAKALLHNLRIQNRPAHAAMMDFYEALFRYRSNPSANRGDRVAEALTRIGDGRNLGASGFLFAGQVYCEIGRYDRAAGLFDAAARVTLGPVSVRMLFEAAERYNELDLRAEARKRYVVVSATESNDWAARAELRLAELAIRDRRGDECIRRCQALLGRDGVERSEVLDRMGRGYELLKMYRSAADCFAGKAPGE
jgi:tetratricopeptide (TPR) repeat protein